MTRRPPRLVIVAHEVGAWANHRARTAELARAAGWEVTLVMGGKGDPVPLAAGAIPAHRTLPMSRGKGGLIDSVRSVLVLRGVLRGCDVVELVTVKPIVMGLAAWRTLLPGRRPRVVATFAGLGTVVDAAISRTPAGASAAAGVVPAGRVPALVRVMRLLLRGHATVLVENPDDGASLVAAGIVRAEDVVVGPGVGLPALWLDLPANDQRANDQRANDARANDPSADDRRFTVLYVGRLIASKGVVDLVAALRVLRERGVPVRALLAGSLDDRNPSAVSAAEVEGWQRDGLVEWLGHVTDLEHWYRQADLVVLPSHREGRPRSLMEAQALGIAVVATDVPGCRQVLDPGVTGILVPPHRPEDLADAVEALIDDPTRRLEMGRRGRTWARQQFGTERFLDVWSATVLGDTPAPGRATAHPVGDR